MTMYHPTDGWMAAETFSDDAESFTPDDVSRGPTAHLL